MAKQFGFQWQITVPDFLVQGSHFDRWEEVSNSSVSCLYLDIVFTVKTSSKDLHNGKFEIVFY
jgi:hypothetical protein